MNRELRAGNMSFKAGKYEDAIKHYTNAIDHDPEMCVAFNNRAMAYLNLKKYVEGEADASRALELEPGNVKALFRRGVAREFQGKLVEAKLDYENVVQLEPKNHAAKEKLQSFSTSAD